MVQGLGVWSMPAAVPRRILIVGAGGSGKSTLARRLGTLCGLPVYHLDALYWHPGWVPTARDRWTELQEELVARPEWIIDGNYGGTLETRLARAQLVIVLDPPPTTCVWRVLKRSLRSLRHPRPDLAPGCPERLNADFFRFLWWIWTFRQRKLPALMARLRAATGLQVAHLRRDRDVAAFVQALRRCPAAEPTDQQ